MSTASNKAAGTRFEKRVAEILSEHGFWVHRLAQSKAGQPFDIIAVKNGKAFPIDCKDCTGLFNVRRIEPNQRDAMLKWMDCGNGDSWFALQTAEKEIYMFSFSFLMSNLTTFSTYVQSAIRARAIPLERWIEECG